MAGPSHVGYSIDTQELEREDGVQIRSRKSSPQVTLDTLDHRIIEMLRANGRITNQEIATQMSVTAATISARLKRLDEIGAARVVAVADFSALSHNVLLAIGVRVARREVLEVADDLAKLPEALSVAVMNGRCDIEMLVVLRAFDDVNELLMKRIASVAGVDAIEPAIATDIAKFEFNVAPLL